MISIPGYIWICDDEHQIDGGPKPYLRSTAQFASFFHPHASQLLSNSPISGAMDVRSTSMHNRPSTTSAGSDPWAGLAHPQSPIQQPPGPLNIPPEKPSHRLTVATSFDHEQRGNMEEIRAQHDLKRSHESTSDAERGGKRMCADAGAMQNMYREALNDISEEISFATKCLDRSAGDQARIHDPETYFR